jgi:hypothetical protein
MVKTNTSKPPQSGPEETSKWRRFRGLLTGLLLGTLATSGLFLYQETPKGAEKAPNTANERRLETGPWGEVYATAIRLEPTDEQLLASGKQSLGWLKTNYLGDDSRLWHVTNNQESVKKLLLDHGFTTSQTTVLLQSWQVVDTNWAILKPSRELTYELKSEQRERWYAALGQWPGNAAYSDPCRYQSEDPEEWLKSRTLKPHYKDLIRPLIYHRGSCVVLSDIDLVLAQIVEEEQQVAAMKMLYAERSFLLKLRVTETSDINKLCDYWGAGPRRKDIAPLLESLRDLPGGAKIDIAHLMPIFPRSRLYTFPPVARNCHWTSLNFFNYPYKNESFSDAEVQEAIATKYTPVPGEPKFGDLVLLLAQNRKEGNLLHSAIYIAGKMIFTKNGMDNKSPYSIMMLEDIEKSYSVDEPVVTVYYRLKPATD